LLQLSHQRRVADRDRLGAERDRLGDVAAVSDAAGDHQVDLVRQADILQRRRASGFAAISGMPGLSLAMCGPAPVPPSAPSR